jgi:hypothetical protein
MKKILVLVTILIVVVACAAPPTNRDSAPSTSTNSAAESSAQLTEAEAIAREKAVWDMLKKKDYDLFAKMLTEDYLEVASDAVYDKAGIVTFLKDLDFTDATFSNWRLLQIDKTAALLMYNLTLKGKFKGQDIPPGPYRVGSAWVNRNGRWQAIFYQETLAQTAPPPPPAPAATTSASPGVRSGVITIPADPIEREKAVWEALKSKDYDTFASFLDSAQVEVEPHGVYDKAGTLKLVRMFDASKGELSDFKTVKINDDATVVTYVVTISGAKPEKERASTIWVNRGGKWLALYHQGTPAEDAPAASPTPAK